MSEHRADKYVEEGFWKLAVVLSHQLYIKNLYVAWHYVQLLAEV